MMISPETYYNDNLKDRSIEEIKSSIRGLKKEITHLKNVMEHPNYIATIKPDESTQLWCLRLYLEKAIQALEEAGESYCPTNAELKVKRFNEDTPYIKEINFYIGGYFEGHIYRKFTFNGDKVIKRVTEILEKDIDIILEKDKEDFLDQLSKLYLGEWRKEYNTAKFGIIIMDGTQWDLEIKFSNGKRSKHIHGDNAYPYNFNDLLELFEVDDEEDYLDLEYTIDLNDKNELIHKMIRKAKELPFNTEISTSQLLQLISKEISYDNGKYIYDELTLEMKDMFSLDYEFKIMAKQNGIEIDETIHAGEVLGMPFHIGFLIKKY